MAILFVKNLSGSFNDEYIGHEIINSFLADDGNLYFYIPPYGCIYKENNSFFKSNIYKNFDIILVFDIVNITNIYKLKQVILNPIPFNSFEEMKEIAINTKYGGKPLIDIDFGDWNFNHKINDLKNEKMKVYLLSYKLDINKVYDFDKDNIFIYVNSSTKRNNLKDKSINLFNKKFGTKAKIRDVPITIGQKQYTYNKLDDLSIWFNKYIKPKCNEKRLMKLFSIQLNDKEIDNYDDTFLSFVKKINDENYYTNYIGAILNNNINLLNNFFKYLVGKFFKVESYNPTNVRCMLQKQCLTEESKLVNKEIKTYNYNKENKDLNCRLIADGRIDIYLEDNSYRIVIENKILSALNGKNKKESDDFNQLNIYNNYLKDLNKTIVKENKIMILCPNSLENNFIEQKIDGNNIDILTYGDLTDFFEKNKELIYEPYRNDFIKTIKRQSLLKNELITYRFIRAIKQTNND